MSHTLPKSFRSGRRGIVLAGGCLALLACGAPAAAKTTITDYIWSDLNAEQQAADAFMQEHPDIEVKVVRIAQGDGYFDKLLTMVAGGQPPDVFALNAQNIGRFYDSGAAADLTPLMQRDGVRPDDFLPGAWVYSRYKGAYYGLPRATIGASFAAQLYVYNRTLFDQAGLAYPRIGWTFDEFLRDAKALTRDANGDGTVEQWGTGMPDLGWWWIWVWSNGGELLDESGTHLTIDSPEALAGLQWAGDLSGKFAVAGPGDFGNGKVGLSMQAIVTTFKKYLSLPELDWGFAQIPAGPQGDGGYSRGGNNVVVMSAAGSHREAAWQYLKFLVSEKQQENEVLKLRDGNPVLKSIAIKWANLYQSGPPHDLQPVIEAKFKPQPVSPTWTDVDTLIKNALKPVFQGENTSAATAVRSVLPAADAALTGD